jgi:hypothetical protein
MTDSRSLIRTFYEKIWNRHDKSVIPKILDAGFSFRGSLGSVRHGHQGFADYVDFVHAASSSRRTRAASLLARNTSMPIPWLTVLVGHGDDPDFGVSLDVHNRVRPSRQHDSAHVNLPLTGKSGPAFNETGDDLRERVPDGSHELLAELGLVALVPLHGLEELCHGFRMARCGQHQDLRRSSRTFRIASAACASTSLQGTSFTEPDSTS